MRLLLSLSGAALLIAACAGSAPPAVEPTSAPASAPANAPIATPTVAAPTATQPAGAPSVGQVVAPAAPAAQAPPAPPATPQAQAASSAATPASPPTGLSTADAVARVRPAVVHIQAEDGVGSGVLYRPDGYILTNYHVVADTRRLMVTISDGRSWPAQVLGVLSDFDLAVLKIDAADLPFALFGDVASLREGEEVIAIGYALDFTVGGPTVTNGIVSAKRPLPGGPTLIQTTVPINPGNSGGPLLNRLGQVVGINALRLNRIGYTTVQGVSFAISGADALAFASGGRSPEHLVATAAVGPAGQAPAGQAPAGQVVAPPNQALPPTPPTPPAPGQAVSVAVTGYDLIPAGPPDSVAYLVGEILNAGPGPIENTRVIVSFLDATGRVVATQVTPTDFRVIPAQERVPFSVPLFQMSAQWAGLQVQASAAPASPDALGHSHRDLVAEHVIFNQPGSGSGGFSLTGTVRNTGPAPARSVRVAAVLYNAEGKVIDAVAAPADAPILQPGQASSFRLNLRRSSGYAHYILVAEGVR